MNSAFYDYVIKIFERIKDEVNGKVRYFAYPEMDSVIFRVTFKAFQFEFALHGVTERMNKGQAVDEIIEEVKAEYKKTLFSAFFRSGQRR